MKNFELEQFSGPLDLLLSLIADEKVDISEVSLSKVTEQFLDYLDKLDNKPPEELADFLVVAARLLLIKSKKLLPQFSPDEDEGVSLEEQLRLYKLFAEAAKKVNNLWLSKNISSFRIEPTRRPEVFTPPTNFLINNLHESLLKLLRRIEPPKPLPQTHIDKSVLLEEKIKNIQTLLKKFKNVNFSEILSNSKNRTEVIITFLALLELVKGKEVFLKQKNSFEDIAIAKV